MNKPDAAENRPDGTRDWPDAGNASAEGRGDDRERTHGDSEATKQSDRHEGAGEDQGADDHAQAAGQDDHGADEVRERTNGDGPSASVDAPRAVLDQTPNDDVPETTDRVPDDDDPEVTDRLPHDATVPPPDDDYPEMTDRLPEDVRFLEVTDYPTGTLYSEATDRPEVTDNPDATDPPTDEPDSLRVQSTAPSDDADIPLPTETGRQQAADGAPVTTDHWPALDGAVSNGARRGEGPPDALEHHDQDHNPGQDQGQHPDQDPDRDQEREQDQAQGQGEYPDQDQDEYQGQGSPTIPAFGLISTLDFSGDTGAPQQSSPDDPIPMLTEVVQVPRYEPEDLPHSLADVDWSDLAQRVREKVLERMLRRSDTLLDAQFSATLQPVVERAIETLTLEVHDALNRMIRDIVARAVTEELTRLHAEISRRNAAPNRPPSP